MPVQPPAPLVCPSGYHLCEPNERQKAAFCDVDIDCFGDADYCHAFNTACPQQKGCCVVAPEKAVFLPLPPPLPPASPAPWVPICPTGTHLCGPNGRQREIFCDVDRDCYGDNDYCIGGAACPQKTGCCIQTPVLGIQPADWVPPLAGDPQLSPAVCERLFRDPGHLFRRMWGVESRQQNHKGDDACWARDRHMGWVSQPAEQFFEDIFSGRYCEGTDWYDGAPFAHGWFDSNAPALLGFDYDIKGFCNNNCDWAGVNILAIFGNDVKYNTCRNFE